MRLKIFFLVIIVGLLTALLEVYSGTIEQSVQEHYFLNQLIHYPPHNENEKDLKKIRNDKPKQLEHFYVTILGNDPVYGYTFQELNQLNQQESLQKEPRLPVLFQFGLEPEINDESKTEVAKPNATIEQRGFSVRMANLKSYKIRLNNGTELWRNQNKINLNKHPYDFTSVRNKLSYDYFKIIPNMVSSETQFVKLHVKDLTSASGESNFVDYGLFTHVEQINKDFLSRHGMDPDGYLYKVINFEFYRYPEQLRNRHDPFYDPEKFEAVLAIRGREYHDNLLQMLDDVNNQELDFNHVFDRYFDKDNFLSWIGVNILMGNLDTSGNNFYLYKSRFSDKWYLLPWDYDKTWDYEWQWGREPTTLHPTKEGLSLYWGWPLVRRFFQQPENVTALNDKLDELSLIITEEQTKIFLDEYYPIVRPIILQLPDVQLLPEDSHRFDEEYYSLVKVPNKNLQKYYANLNKPMPIFIGGPWFGEGQMTFTWWESYSLQGNEIYYDLQISENPDFSTLYFEKKGLQGTELTMEILAEGSYYWRVITRDSKGNEQISFESLMGNNGKLYHGIKSFTIE